MIVVEGPDNSGKSRFGRSLGLTYYSAGPAPSDAAELLRCLTEQRNRASLACVQDRLTCISQQVYSDAPESSLLNGDLLQLVEVPKVVIVYCRPPTRTLMDLSTHVVKSYDTEENMEKIARNQHLYIDRYDRIMGRIPHVGYDWTENDDESNRQIRSLLVTTQHSVDDWKRLRDTMNMGKITF